MSRSDAERWDARWAALDGTTAVVPPDVLVDHDLIELVPTAGRALDVACGRGGQARWLAQRGLDVLAIDVSAHAIRLLLADAAGDPPTTGALDAWVHDLDAGLPTAASDVDVIVCQRFRGTALYGSLVEALRPGGLVVLTVLSQVGAATPGQFHAPSGELTDAFSALDVDVILHSEADGQASIVARRR